MKKIASTKFICSVIAMILIASSAVFPQASNDPFSTDFLKKHISVLADDSMMGRSTPSEGLKKAGKYIAEEFQKYGLEPYGDNGTFYQSYPLRRMIINPRTTKLTFLNNQTELNYIEDFIRVGGGGIFRPGSVSGELLVIAGDYSDRNSLKKFDIKDKFVLYIYPRTTDGSLTENAVRNMFWIASEAPKMVLSTSEKSEQEWSNISKDPEEYLTSYISAAWHNDSGKINISFLEIKNEFIKKFLDSQALSLDKLEKIRGIEPFVKGVNETVKIQFSVQIDELLWADNIIGIVEGSDPLLKNEYIVYTAHYDHLGIFDGNIDDKIFNGADDNASGTAALLAAAKAFSNLEKKPSRSIIFNAVSGEELGLWGSEYFVKKFPQASQKIIANLNADMIGRAYIPNSVYAMGKELNSIGDTIDKIVKESNIGLTVLSNEKAEQDFKNQNLFARSDHLNFLKNGIPCVFFSSSGFHSDYHETSDEIMKIDFQITSEIARLIFLTGLDLANKANRPAWEVDYTKIKLPF